MPKNAHWPLADLTMINRTFAQRKPHADQEAFGPLR